MKKLLFFVCAIFAFVACTQAPIEEQQGIEINTPEILTVGFEDGDQTRIQLNEVQKTVWNKSDLVSVFYRSDANQKWQYQGETGERVGNLKRVENATSTTKTTKTIVVYPYSESYWLNTDSYAIEATLPATQHYTAGSYGIGSNLMVSQSEFTQFSLKSVCGWLKLQLTGDGSVVKSIKFRGNNEEQVAGLIYVDTATAEATLASEMGGTDDNNAGGNLVFDDTILTELTLDCGEGVTLDEEVTTFYLSLPPQTFTNGFTVDIECVDNEPFTLSTTNELIIERNTIQPMAAVEVEHEPVEVKPANNEIWYTNGSTTEAATPNRTDVFGVNIVSNTYDAEKECWVIKFDGDVTKIGTHAFQYCSSLTSVTIPDSVTTIGYHAFYYCSSLTSVTIGNSVTTIGEYAFDTCSSLTSVTIPDSVTTIGDWAFSYCYGLTSVTIGNSVTTIGKAAFYCCYGLTSVTIGNSVTTIGEGVFRNCSQLQEFKGKFASEDGRCLIIEGVLELFAPASITEYTIPDGVTTIGYQAFYACYDLTSVTIPNSVTTIGDYAFSACSSLTSVTIPNSVTTIGEVAFGRCSHLQEFKGKFASDDGRCLIIEGVLNSFAPAGLTEYAIPNSVTTIGVDAFSECSGLTSVTIPDSVTTIKASAFSYCSSLTSVTIPDSVTTIDDYAFGFCKSLTSVTIPDSVTTIGYQAFYYCSSLKSVYCEDTTPPTGYYCMFDYNASDRKIYVPRNSVEAYKSASGWSDYAEDIVGYDFATDETLQPANNEIWYTNGSTTEATTPRTTDDFGANILSNTYDAEKECWVIKFEGDVTTIGGYAFYWCSSLTSVTIPNSVTTIDKAAFSCCSMLQEFKGKFASDDGRCLIQDGTLIAFAPAGLTEYAIPNSVITIGYEAFSGCSSLTSVTIPNSVTTIGDNAFQSCSSLTSVNIPNSVTTIGDWAFQSCSSLTSVTIPDSVTTIGDYAFAACGGLTSVTIPDSVTTIGYGAFHHCSMLQEFKGKFASDDGRCLIQDGTLIAFVPAGLTEYAIPNSVTAIDNEAFAYCNSLTSVTIPNSVTTIGDFAFSSCSGLTSVTIPNSVTTIGDWAFQSCSSLTSVNIPNSVTTMGEYAFYWCTSLTSVTIGNGVTSIGSEAFSSCYSLKEVYCKPTTPPRGGLCIFDSNASGRKIYVPRNSVSAYQAASGWSNYAEDIVGYDF